VKVKRQNEKRYFGGIKRNTVPLMTLGKVLFSFMRFAFCFKKTSLKGDKT